MTTREWHTVKAAIALKAIILNKQGEILILQRPEDDYSRPSGYDLVGGGLEEFESPEEGLKREIKEETNLSVTNISPIATESFKEEDGCFTVMIGFVCEVETDTVILSSEHKQFKWLTPEEALQLDLPHTYKNFIQILKR